MFTENINQSINAEAICRNYNLGKVMRPLEKVSGGLIHKMWKMVTSKGSFALKELNSEIMKRPSLIENMNKSEMIANKYKEFDVDAVCTIGVDNAYVFENSGKYFMVYPWIDGKVITDPADVTLEIARKISLNLAKIHKINFKN